jgi:putative hydrolase of the HAD superfamily
VVKTPFRALTFDVGGTLIECSPSVGHIYAEVAAEHGGKALDPHLLNRRFTLAWAELKNFSHTSEQWAALVDATFAGLLPELPSKTFFGQLYERFAAADAWRVFDDVLPVLQQLKDAGCKLGIISNWDDRLRPLLKALQLEPFFDSIVVSCEVDAPKPSPVIYQAAADSLGFQPAKILHIGDDRAKDFEGAEAAGFQALLLRRKECNLSPGTIRTLSDLTGKWCPG